MKFSPKRKLQLTIAVLLFAFAIVVVFVIYPIFVAFGEKSEKFLEAREELLTLTEKRSQLGRLEQRQSINAELFAKIGEVLYEKDIDDLEFILLVEEIAKKTGNVHTLSVPKYVTSEKGLSYFSSTIVLDGDFDSLLRFLELFSVMKFYADIDGITIQKAKEFSASKPLLHTTLQFKVFTK